MKINFQNDIENCWNVLRNGGTILYPTDTVWGIGCDAINEEAVKKIINIKQRLEEKSFVVLVSSEKEVLQHVAAPDLAVFDFLKTQKNPTTVIYEHALGFADKVVAKDGSVAIRICRDKFCIHLINRLKKPLVSTSANISNAPAPYLFDEIDEIIKKNVDYVVQYRQKENVISTPSSIIRWGNGKPVFIRK